jgi:SnoaL-like polyketide cyclase
MFFETFPDCISEFQDPTIFGDHAIQLSTGRGTDTGGLLGQLPTGKPFSLLVVYMMTFGQGLIVHERRIYDRGGLLLQLAGEAGATPEATGLYRSTLDKAVVGGGIRRAITAFQS